MRNFLRVQVFFERAFFQEPAATAKRQPHINDFLVCKLITYYFLHKISIPSLTDVVFEESIGLNSHESSHLSQSGSNAAQSRRPLRMPFGSSVRQRRIC